MCEPNPVFFAEQYINSVHCLLMQSKPICMRLEYSINCVFFIRFKSIGMGGR
jgi:hypothetical protein